MTTPPLAGIPIPGNEELTDHWTSLLAPPVFGARALWLTWLDDDYRPLPLVVPVDGIPPVPDRGMLQGLLHLHDAVATEHLTGEGHLAMALCRPGPPAITEDDDEWAEALHDLLDDGQIDGTWSLHLAAGGQVLPLVDLRR
jgi:hypothetical protein